MYYCCEIPAALKMNCVCKPIWAKQKWRDKWDELEHKWGTAEKNLHHSQQETKETTDELKKSAKVVMEELSSAYDRIKTRLND